MTIELRITDLNTVDKEVLKHTAAYLLALAGHELVKAPEVPQANNTDCVTNETDKTTSSTDETALQTQTVTKPQLPEILNNVDFAELEKDSEGKEWNPMLHSSTRKKNADGTWRLKRGIEPTKKIEDAVQEQPLLSNNVEETQTKQEVSTAATVAEKHNASFIDTDIFIIFTQKAVQAINAGALSQADIIRVANTYGLKNVPAIATRPDLIPLIAAELSINLVG